jgi:hypothetical protein
MIFGSPVRDLTDLTAEYNAASIHDPEGPPKGLQIINSLSWSG